MSLLLRFPFSFFFFLPLLLRRIAERIESMKNSIETDWINGEWDMNRGNGTERNGTESNPVQQARIPEVTVSSRREFVSLGVPGK